MSNFDVDRMAKFSAVLPVQTLQPPYSLFQREVEARILPYTEVNEIGVLAYGPLVTASSAVASAIRPLSPPMTGVAEVLSSTGRLSVATLRPSPPSRHSPSRSSEPP